MGPELLPFFLPAFLYAETHYKFRYFFSWLRKKEPEIVIDAPRFVEPGRPIPVLVIVKDAHKYPAVLLRISLRVRKGEQTVLTQELLTARASIAERLWWRIFEVGPIEQTGWVTVEPLVEYRCNTSTKRCGIDNYKGSSQKPLDVYLAQDLLPHRPSLYFGDCHTHSSYTDDQVEFGAPLGASVELAKAAGLSFFCVTDHSYDLDDSAENFLVNDPYLPKWRALLAETERLNSVNSGTFSVIPGEEVSCRNGKDGNVHLLVLGDRSFHKGSGDSAEKWFKTFSENSITDILRAKSAGSIAVAAHPREPVPKLQRLLLGRSEWSQADLASDGLDALQFLNGRASRSFEWGMQEWIRLLLMGKRIVALAGTDAHGNFNRFRQQGIPFFTIEEHHHQLFGQFRTGVLLDSSLTEQSVLKALKAGACVLTDGPVCVLKATSEVGDVAGIGAAVSAGKILLEIDARSTRDFGKIESLDVFHGMIGEQKEVLILQEVNLHRFDLNISHTLSTDVPGYVRVMIRTSGDNTFGGGSHFCMTNPIWIEPSRRKS